MTTLSKEQAITISDALLAEKEHRPNRMHTFLFGFVHPFYRFRELSNLPLWQQARLVNAAGRLADKQFAVLLAYFLFVAAILSAAFFAPPPYQGYSTFVAIFALLGIPAALIRRAAVHQHAILLLANEPSAQ
jgi:hypothetical protein